MALVQHLLWDASHALKVQDVWRRRPAEGVYSRFLMTSGGLSLIQPAEAAEGARRQLDPFRNTLYRWASRTRGCVLSVSRGRSYDLTAACRILYKDSFVAGGKFSVRTGVLKTILKTYEEYSSGFL